MSVEYLVSVGAGVMLLGQDPEAILQCRALGHETRVLTFGHASLVLLLRRTGSEAELAMALPNVGAMYEDEVLVRTQAMGGEEDLQPNETRERRYSLLPLFPELLSLGDFTFKYVLESSAGAEPLAPARFSIRPGPGCIPHLIGLLDDFDSGLGSRAAGLLRKMTGQMEIGNIGGWWQRHGGALRWNAAAQAATAEGSGIPPARGKREELLGGVVLPATPFTSRQKQRFLEAAEAWIASGELPDLRGAERLADEQIDYPTTPAVFQCDGDILGVLGGALDRLPGLDPKALEGAAAILLRTVAACPDFSFLPRIARLEAELEGTSAEALCGGLLDWMHPTRVPAVL